MSEKVVHYDWKVIKQVRASLASSNIDGHLLRRRYRLDVTLKRKNTGKTALFIMMNPSKADDLVADDTIKKIITYVNRRAVDTPLLSEVGKIIFVNLYAIFETNPSNVNELINNYGVEFIKGVEQGAILNNDNTIKDAIEEADIKFAAWGEANISGYEERIDEVNELLINEALYCIGEPTENGFPRHLSRINYKWNIQRYN